MKSISLLILISLWQIVSYAQTDSTLIRLNTFVKNIQIFNHLYPQEKVYLHFDNTGYFLQESIWFKAYVTTASHLTPTLMSRVLYVELLNEEGHVVSTQKLPITDGQADGSIPLTKLGMKSGFYEVRAYTRLMLNWDKETLFSRVFPVFEVPKNEGDYKEKSIRPRPASLQIPWKREKTPSTHKLNVEFYPEGGQLVNGLTSTVAFKVTDKKGCAQEASGYICNAQGDTVSVFSTLHEGMGSFSYTPTEEKIKLWIRSAEEKKSTEFDLPAAEQSGCVMQIQNLHPEQMRIRISSTPEYASTPLGLTIMCRGEAKIFKILSSIPEGGYVLTVPKSKLSAGVNQITLFTPQGKVLAERLAYIPGNSHPLEIKVRQEKSIYQPLEEINMEVSVQDLTGQPVQTTLSLSVRDRETEIPSSYGETLCSNLLLSSDLKGYISNPEYYFESEDNPHRLALDLLMLTQGYRRYPEQDSRITQSKKKMPAQEYPRYSWTQMAGITPFEATHKIEKGILIDGVVKSLVKQKAREDIDVKMTMFSDSGFQQAYCPTDSTGAFNYLASDFYGKWKLQLNTRKNNKRKECWITLNRLFSPKGRTYSFYDTYIPPANTDLNKLPFLLENNDSINAEMLRKDSLELALLSKQATTLKEVVVKAKKARNAFISKGINLMYDVEEEENKLEDKAEGYNEDLISFLEHINPFFHGKSYKGKPVYFMCSSSLSPDNVFSQNAPGVSMSASPEETPIDNFMTGFENSEARPDYTDLLYSSDIESVAIIEDPSVYFTLKPEMLYSPKPAVLVMLKLNSRRAKAREPRGVRLTTLQGFSRPREFYSPNYKEYKLPDEKDFRRTLYWNPNIKTDLQGKASVSFFNNSTCQDMKISAETMTPDGTFGSYTE